MKDEKITTPLLVEKIKDYVSRAGNEVGGNLFMVLSNYNIHNDHIQYCLNQANERGDQAGVDLAKLLLKASKTQRLKACKSWRYPV